MEAQPNSMKCTTHTRVQYDSVDNIAIQSIDIYFELKQNMGDSSSLLCLFYGCFLFFDFIKLMTIVFFY